MIPVILLAGCQQARTPATLAERSTTISKTINLWTLTPAGLPVTETRPDPSDTPSPSAVGSTTETPVSGPEPVICSPLSEHVIGELPGIISSPYDPPPMGKDDRHQGVDFAYYNQPERPSIEGEGIQAIAGGWVAAVIDDRLPYGNMVILETPQELLTQEIHARLNIGPGESLYHLYAHMNDSPLASLGSWVEWGQLIGYVGKSGYNVPVAHLHLETRIGPSGTRFDGMVFYDTRATVSEMENYKTWRMSGTYRHFDPMVLFTLDEMDIRDEEQ